MRKIIMHIDLNQFFAAATRLLEPSLIGKPLIIAGDHRRGIVSTASYEARKYGIHSAMPTYMAKKLCPHVEIRPSNFEWYTKTSNEFFSFIKEKYTSKIEVASIDECYVDMTDLISLCYSDDRDSSWYFEEDWDVFDKPMSDYLIDKKWLNDEERGYHKCESVYLK